MVIIDCGTTHTPTYSVTSTTADARITSVTQYGDKISVTYSTGHVFEKRKLFVPLWDEFSKKQIEGLSRMKQPIRNQGFKNKWSRVLKQPKPRASFKAWR